MSNSWKRYLAWGSGAGIEIGADQLKVSLAKVRPSAVTEPATLVIENFRERPAAEWGREYNDFLRKNGASPHD